MTFAPRSFACVAVLVCVACDPGGASPGQPAQPPGQPDTDGCTAASSDIPEALEVRLPASVPAPSLGVAGIAGLARGMNLGNALEAPVEGEWGVVLEETHFRMIAEAGFDHVRLPVRFSAYTDSSPPHAIDEDILSRVDWALDQAEAHGLSLILDVHHFDDLVREPDAHTDRFVAIWEQLAERYADRPDSVKYELLNEPNGALDAVWNDVYPLALAAVRERDPQRTVLVDSTFWAAARTLNQLELVDDPHLVATFHMYEPILFTHQGAPWMGPEYQTTNVVFPGPGCVPVTPASGAEAVSWVKQWFQRYNEDRGVTNPGGAQAVENVFAFVDSFVSSTGRAVYMGEFAVIDKAEPASRERWVRLVRDHAEARNIPWAYWDDGGMNRAYDVKVETWVPYLRRALLD